MEQIWKGAIRSGMVFLVYLGALIGIGFLLGFTRSERTIFGTLVTAAWSGYGVALAFLGSLLIGVLYRRRG